MKIMITFLLLIEVFSTVLMIYTTGSVYWNCLFITFAIPMLTLGYWLYNHSENRLD